MWTAQILKLCESLIITGFFSIKTDEQISIRKVPVEKTGIFQYNSQDRVTKKMITAETERETAEGNRRSLCVELQDFLEMEKLKNVR